MTEIPAGLAEAIDARREALAQQLDDEQAYRAAVELVELLLQRSQLTGEDPVEALGVAGELDKALQADSPARALPLLHLAVAHWAGARHHGEQSLQAALARLRELRPLLDDELPMHVAIRARCGMLCADIAVLLGDEECAAQAIADLDAAFPLLTDDELRHGAQIQRAQLCSARFREMGGPDSDLHYAVDTFTAILDRPGIPPELADHCHLELVNLIVAEHLPRHARTSAPWSEQQAAQYTRAAPAAALRAHLDALSPQTIAIPGIAGIRVNVIVGQASEATRQDWDVLGGDLSTLIGALDEHDPHRHMLVAVRAALGSDPPPVTELDQTLAELRRELIAADGSAAGFGILAQLNALLIQRAELTGQGAARCVEVAEAMVAFQPELPAARIQLALAHAARDAREDLRRAAEILRDLHPADDAERSEFLAHRGFISTKLALNSQDPADVAEAIELLDAALDGLPDGDLRRRTWMFRASMYQVRYLRMGGTADDHRLASEAFTEALAWDDPHTQDGCHAALAMLLLFRDVPAELRVPEPDPEELHHHLDRTSLPEVQRHLAAVSDTSDDELAAIRLLAWSADPHADADPHGDFASFLRDFAAASGDDLSPVELDAIRSVTAALPGRQDDAEVKRLLATASEGLPADSPLHGMFLLPLVRSPESLSSDDLANLIRQGEQRLEALPEGSPEHADGLTSLIAFLVVQGLRGDRAALERAKEIAQHVTQRYPDVGTLSGMSHALLALSAEYGLGHSLEAVQETLDHVRRADELLASDDQVRAELNPVVGKMLMARFLASGNREDADAAQYYSAETPHPPHEVLAWANEVWSKQLTDVDTGLSKLRAAAGDGVPDHRARWIVRGVIALRLLVPREFRAGSTPPSRADLDAARRALLAARRLPESDENRAIELSGAAALCAASGIAADDLALADEGLAALDEVSKQPGLSTEVEYFTVQLLAYARQGRSWHRASSDALDSAIDGLERMIRERPPGTGEALAANLTILAGNYEERGDLRRAIETGLEALRTRARGVLLQSSPQRAMSVASAAAGSAVVAAHRCLRADDLESAVQALELGRGMVLHAATSAATMPDLLRDSGHPDLAERWSAEVDQQQPWDSGSRRSSPAELQLPSDLRLSVQRALKDTAAEEELLSPPSSSEISAALRARSARALVYLTAGEAVVITDGGELHHLPLPALREREPVQHFDLLQRERARVGPAVQQPWQAALHDLCDWAWTAAIGPLLDWFGGDRPPRIVLVPTGKLNLVPWHAARKPGAGGRSRYACQDAVIGYAASARQFVEAARRQAPRFADRPVLVRTPDLYWTRHEIGHIHAAHYAHGHYLGRPGQRSVPSPDDVLTALPGTTMLHLGCHATPAELPVESALRLGSRSLPVRDVLRHKSGPRGALVVLAACSSDLTARQHDEALTLATAFLAAGAGGVVGTRWEIDDLVTAMFMIAFHHHLNDGSPEPAEALRAAQLWMLDPHRHPVPGVPDELARHFAETDPATPEHWAAFTYHGR